jgi:hypothetical protein
VRSPSPAERGGITAEFMITLPVLVMVFVVMSLAIGQGLTQHRLQQLASDHARVLSLGGDPDALPVLEGDGPAAIHYEADVVCVGYHRIYDSGLWALAPLNLGATACALNPLPPAP